MAHDMWWGGDSARVDASQLRTTLKAIDKALAFFLQDCCSNLLLAAA